MQKNEDDLRIDALINQLDKEISIGSVRVSVEEDKNLDKAIDVSHNACRAYGKIGTETIGLLDMYTDHCINEYDRE